MKESLFSCLVVVRGRQPFFFLTSVFNDQRFSSCLSSSLSLLHAVPLAHVAPPSLLPCEKGNISRTLLYFFSSFYLLSCSFLSRCFFDQKKETVTFSLLFLSFLSPFQDPIFLSSILFPSASYYSFCIWWTFRRSFSFEMRDPDFSWN